MGLPLGLLGCCLSRNLLLGGLLDLLLQLLHLGVQGARRVIGVLVQRGESGRCGSARSARSARSGRRATSQPCLELVVLGARNRNSVTGFDRSELVNGRFGQ